MTDRAGLLGRSVPGATRVLLAIAALALAGATAFGLWHLVVGGLINGNLRAGMFGLGLALGAGLTLVISASLVRRRRSPSV